MKKSATNYYGLGAVQPFQPTAQGLVWGLLGLIGHATISDRAVASDPVYRFEFITTIGSPAPGSGAFVRDFEPTRVNNRGQLAFAAIVTDGITVDDVLLLGTP